MWNPIVNLDMMDNDENDRKGISRMASTTKLLLEYIEGNTNYVWAARRRSAIDFRVGWIL